MKRFITFGNAKTTRSTLSILFRYLRYYINAKTAYQIHSPFLYQFINECIIDNNFYYIFNHIDEMHQALLQDQSEIQLIDYGAGSRKTDNTTIASIAKNATSPSWKGIQLYHIARFIQPKVTLELGSNLGIGTAYLAAPVNTNTVFTIEGDPSLHKYANQHWQKLEIENIRSFCGEFSATLPLLLSEMDDPIDLVYLDGNHRKDATIAYVEQILPYLSSKGAIIVDDIQWSSGMIAAWEELITISKFCYSINLGQYGVLFWDETQSYPNQHVTYISYKYKPWKIGLFAH